MTAQKVDVLGQSARTSAGGDPICVMHPNFFSRRGLALSRVALMAVNEMVPCNSCCVVLCHHYFEYPLHCKNSCGNIQKRSLFMLSCSRMINVLRSLGSGRSQTSHGVDKVPTSLGTKTSDKVMKQVKELVKIRLFLHSKWQVYKL